MMPTLLMTASATTTTSSRFIHNLTVRKLFTLASPTSVIAERHLPAAYHTSWFFAATTPTAATTWPTNPAHSPHCYHRSYTTRAHPVPTPQNSLLEAVRLVLEEAERRQVKRAERWEKFREKRKIGQLKKGSEFKEEGPFRNQDETISLAVRVNLDPRKPNQTLRGQLALPHGTGREIRIAVFSLSATVINAALEQGAVLAGGKDLITAIQTGEQPIDTFDRVIATPDVVSILQKNVARILGPRGLMPNPKMGNIVKESEVPYKVKEVRAGTVTYRTEKNAGLVHVPVGKASFGAKKLLQNLRALMEGLVDVEPELDKKAKKARVGGKGGKFFLKAHISATQGPGFKIDMRTADPNHALFMTDGKMK